MNTEKKEELRQHLESASASLEMALQTMDEMEWGDLQDWHKEFMSDATVRAWTAQRNIDRTMEELAELQ